MAQTSTTRCNSLYNLCKKTKSEQTCQKYKTKCEKVATCRKTFSSCQKLFGRTKSVCFSTFKKCLGVKLNVTKSSASKACLGTFKRCLETVRDERSKKRCRRDFSSCNQKSRCVKLNKRCQKKKSSRICQTLLKKCNHNVKSCDSKFKRCKKYSTNKKLCSWQKAVCQIKHSCNDKEKACRKSGATGCAENYKSCSTKFTTCAGKFEICKGLTKNQALCLVKHNYCLARDVCWNTAKECKKEKKIGCATNLKVCRDKLSTCEAKFERCKTVDPNSKDCSKRLDICKANRECKSTFEECKKKNPRNTCYKIVNTCQKNIYSCEAKNKRCELYSKTTASCPLNLQICQTRRTCSLKNKACRKTVAAQRTSCYAKCKQTSSGSSRRTCYRACTKLSNVCFYEYRKCTLPLKGCEFKQQKCLASGKSSEKCKFQFDNCSLTKTCSTKFKTCRSEVYKKNSACVKNCKATKGTLCALKCASSTSSPGFKTCSKEFKTCKKPLRTCAHQKQKCLLGKKKSASCEFNYSICLIKKESLKSLQECQAIVKTTRATCTAACKTITDKKLKFNCLNPCNIDAIKQSKSCGASYIQSRRKLTGCAFQYTKCAVETTSLPGCQTKYDRCEKRVECGKKYKTCRNTLTTTKKTCLKGCNKTNLVCYQTCGTNYLKGNKTCRDERKTCQKSSDTSNTKSTPPQSQMIIPASEIARGADQKSGASQIVSSISLCLLVLIFILN
jgi:hypothetical protein